MVDRDLVRGFEIGHGNRQFAVRQRLQSREGVVAALEDLALEADDRIVGTWIGRGFGSNEPRVALLLAAGTLLFMIIEGFWPVDSFYFSFVTLSTLGYGDITPVIGPAQALA